MERLRGEIGRKGLVAVLIVLCAVILILAITVLLVQKNVSQKELGQAESELPIELLADNLSPEDEVIKETSVMFGDPDYDADQIKAYYDRQIKSSLDRGDTGLAMKVILLKMDFLSASEDSCTTAKDYVNSVDLSPFSANDKRYLATYVISMAINCNDQDLETRWNEIYERTENEE